MLQCFIHSLATVQCIAYYVAFHQISVISAPLASSRQPTFKDKNFEDFGGRLQDLKNIFKIVGSASPS